MIPNDRSQITAEMIKNRDFKKCSNAGCPRMLSPTDGPTCTECARVKTYFQATPGPAGQNVPPTGGRPY